MPSHQSRLDDLNPTIDLAQLGCKNTQHLAR
jgi:hypothetical protein